MITKTKTDSLSSLIKKADKLFSEIVRREDAKDGFSRIGHIDCPICRNSVHWKMADAAHVFDRDNLATRYDELNVWATCRECNRYDPEHRQKFKDTIRRIIGDGEFDCLEERAHSMVKFTRSEMTEMIERFKEKLKKL